MVHAWLIALSLLPAGQGPKFDIQPGFMVERGERKGLVKRLLPKFIDVPVRARRSDENSTYADIMNRVSSPSLGNGRWMDCHESCHFIAADLRQEHGGEKVDGMYCLKGKAVILVQPAMRKSAVAPFIPPSLRNYRYATYVTGQPSWEACPLHIAQEWMAYYSECVLAGEDIEAGRPVERNVDQASGTLELGIYSVGLAMAIEKHDPEYLKNHPDFMNFMVYQWNQAKVAYEKIAHLFPSSGQTRQLNNLRTSPDAEPMRAFIKKNLDGVWLEP